MAERKQPRVDAKHWSYPPNDERQQQQVDRQQQRFKVAYRSLRETHNSHQLTSVRHEHQSDEEAELTSNSRKSNSAAHVYISVWKSL